MTIEAYAQISGSVYLDINSDGVRQNAYPFIEPGVEGISVTAYNAANMSVGTTTTAADGAYSLAVPAGSYRVEFTWTFTWLNPGVAGGTTVQFVTAPAASVNLAVLDPALFNDDSNPHMVSPCYVGKEYNGLYASMDALVGFRYNSTGTAHGDHIFAAQHQDIGATWGLAYNKVSKRMFVSATARRHVGFGPQGPGAVYIFNYNDPTAPVADGFIDLSTLLTTTADPRTATSFNGVTNATSWDPEIFDLVGKMSFGDIEISEDGNHLWVMNLSDRMVYRIDISGLPAPLTAGDVTAYGGLDPGCANGDYRPWALKIWRGEVYAGVVCSGQTSQNINDVNAWVMKLTGGSFTPFYGPIALDFTRGKTGDPATSASTRWQPWVNTFSQLIVSGNTSPGYPQPILSDIEFDVDGSIILGFMDRTASQLGRQNLSNDTGSSAVYSSDSGGDILRVCNIGGTYFIEGSVSGCTTISPPHPTNPSSNRNLGINGQEYYWSDFTSGLSHSETAQGALAFLPGTEEVVTTTMVPIDARTGGIRWMSNTTGAATDNYEIVDTPASSGGQGKSNGLGDMELLLGIAPIEIGNRVWNDANNNGVQDPGESGIAGVVIELWADTDGNGSVDTKVAQTTTNAQGLYLFSEAGVNAVGGTEDWSFYFGDEDQVETLANYQIRISTSQGALTGLSVTLQNSAASGGITSNNLLTDIRDSDIDIFGRVSFTTGGPGQNNHGLDAGFSAVCGVTVVSATPSVCDPVTNTYSLSVVINYVNQPAGQITISTSAGASQNFTPTGTSPETFTLTGLPANGISNISVTAAFVATPTCTSTLTAAYNAPANCTPVCAITALQAIPSVCNPATNQYTLAVTVTYENPPAGNITITTTSGASQTFTPTGISPETFTLMGLNSDGATSIGVTAFFVNNPSCTYTQPGAYDAPENCEPCQMTVVSAVPSVCDPLTNTYSLEVTVTYANRPTGNIRITADGVNRNFTPSAPVGGGATQTFTMTGLSANGTMNMSVTAHFISDPSCTFTLNNAYNEPDDCAPVCEITSVTASASPCDPVTNNYTLTVMVTYANPPTGNIIIETTEGATITVPVTSSVQTILLPGLNSDGATGIGVTAYFQDSPGCTFTAPAAYNAPAACQARDWGDLRDNNTTNNYPTNSTDGGEGVGPSHIIVPGLRIGATIDAESNGEQSVNADGDDNNDTDDEDGVTLPMLLRGQTVTVPVEVYNMTGSPATLYAFFDFNNNKVLNDAGEVFSAAVPDGTNATLNLSVAVPAGAVLNTTIGIRFRLSTDPVTALPTGPANDGEVEDYLAQVMEFDWGDLPDLTALAGSGDYQTTASNDGPRHRIYTTIRLGASVDAETDGQPNATATGDGADEDGVTFPELIAGQTAALTVNVRNVTGTQAKLVGFFDWDNDGNFSSPGEMASLNIATGTTGNITMNVPVPATAVRNTPLGARFRISTDPDFVANMLPTGMANNGEVEDYMIQVVAYDWGDLRDNNVAGDYPTNATNGGGEGVGPSHRIVAGLKIGNHIDFETDGLPSTTANGDDNNQSPDDEDGVTLPSFLTAGTTVSVSVNVMNMMTPGAAATLYGFIDFNNNGVLNDAGETASVPLPDGTNGVVNLTFNVPANAVINTFVGARFRLSADPAAALPTGRADDGEVEDYRIEIRDFDWGDLPDLAVGTSTGNYLTTAANDGPRHRLGYGIKFGALVDGETNGQPTATADGDDSNGVDDEDGITLPTFIAGRTATVQMQVMNIKGNGVAARISAWFDWNNNGELELSERVSVANAVPDGYSGPFDLNVNVPVSAVLNTPLGMRFRISQNNIVIVNPTGEAFDGEVEDYLGMVVGYDWGDLPDQNNFTAVRYPTNSTNSASEGIGPSHRITPGIRIGTFIDAEATGQSSTTAGFTSGGDDANGVDDDEDGVAIPAMTIGTPAVVQVQVLNTTGTDANLYAFFDWNRDGDFDDSGERVTVPVPDGTNGTVNVNVTPPVYTLAATNLFARFRLSTDPAAMHPAGEAMDGEVEDYRFTVTGFDRGDLPDSGPGTGAGNYLTTLADNGATHTINQNLFMGARVDSELDGQPNVDALGDDNMTSDDEDGVMIPDLIVGQTISIPVQVRNLTTATNANVYGYIDFNNNGDLSDPGEQTSVEAIPFGTALTTVNLTITIPNDAVLNTPLGARFRLGQASPSSVGNGSAGEVEDYIVSISGYDYGDLPAGYPVTLADDGPRHLVVPGIKLGATIDPDADGTNTPDADGDDMTGIDDEDGVTLPIFERGQTASVDVQVMNMTGEEAKLVAFFDWDNNGNFSGPGEMVSATVSDGTNGPITLSIPVPVDAVTNTNLGARFRLSTDPVFVATMLPTGSAYDGEIEDYLAQVGTPNIAHDKTGPVIGTQQPNGSYNVTYTITVTNSGSGAGTYSLYDTPTFDDDIAINSTPTYTTNAPGHPANPGPVNLSSINGTSNTIATGQAIAAAATHTYTLTYNVTLNLEPASGGNNMYTACGSVAPGTPVAGQGLFNQSRLDAGNDGTIDETDQVCGDLPYLVLTKTADAVTDNGSGNYTITYTLTVSNLGGAAANYTLTDTPGFDDDATITGASYTALLPPAAVTAPITLSPIPPAPSWGIGTANQAIAAGAVHTYTLTVTANVDLSAGSTGNNFFRNCVTTTTTTSMPGDAFFNSATLQGMGTTTVTRVRETCIGPMSPSGYSIGSTVFRDLNNNGLQDPTETGIAGVTMQIWEVVGDKDPTPGSPAGADGADILVPVGSDGTLETADDALPYVSDAAGNYFFTGLSARSYYVVIPGTAFGAGGALQMLPTSSSPAVTDTNDNREDGDDNGVQMGGSGTMVMSPVIALGPGEVEPTGASENYQGGTQDDGDLDDQGDMTVDFGFFAPVSVGDYVWIDLDGNGLQNDPHPVQGMTVSIYNAATNALVALDADGNAYTPTQMTNAMGGYLFTNLPPGNYYVMFDRGTIPNADLYTFTTPNAQANTQDATDSDAVPTTGTMASTHQTGFLPSGSEDLTLDAGLLCNIQVEAGTPQTICSTRPLQLSLPGASISPASLGGVWSSSGDGTFTDGGGSPATAFGTAVMYIPGPNDIQSGMVTLTLTSNNPAALAPPSLCPPVSDTVVITVLKVDCGSFPWNGN